MQILTIPEAFTQTYEFKTRVMTGRSGSEQRVAMRQIPRQTLQMRHLADSNETIQSWKYQFITKLDDLWELPLWAEMERATATAAGNTATGDFSFMDDDLADKVMMMHPDGVTYETAVVDTRNATTVTILTTWANTYPEGSVLVPLENVYVDNNSGYAAAQINAATVDIVATPVINRVLQGKLGTALTTYNGKNVLVQPHISKNAEDVFSQRLQRIDFGHKISIESAQVYGNIISGRSYISRGREDRQQWKLFLLAISGAQKGFYCSTHRPDMTVTTQPAAGTSTFQVADDATVASGWEFIPSHTHLALEMADGDTLYRQIDTVGTIDNGDGTHTVDVTTNFTDPVDNRTITKVSFLELVRLASDSVDIEHYHDHRVVNLSLRTIAA